MKTINIKASEISNRLKSIYDHAEDLLSIIIENNSNLGVLLTTAKRAKELKNKCLIYCGSQKKTELMVPEYYSMYKGSLRLRYLDKNYDKDNRSGTVDIIFCTKKTE